MPLCIHAQVPDFDVEALVGSWERTMAVAEEVARYSAWFDAGRREEVISDLKTEEEGEEVEERKAAAEPEWIYIIRYR